MRGNKATSSSPATADDTSSSFEQPFILITVRLIYISLMIAAAVLPFAGIIGSAYVSHQGLDILAPILATIAVATIIVLLDLKTPRKQLSLVVAVYLALLAGLLAAIAIGALIDLIAATWDLPQGDMALKYLTLLKLATGLTFCYLAVSIVLTTRDNIRLVIPYVEFAKQIRGIRPMLIDTSVLVDGRINMFCRTDFLMHHWWSPGLSSMNFTDSEIPAIAPSESEADVDLKTSGRCRMHPPPPSPSRRPLLKREMLIRHSSNSLRNRI